MPAKLEVNRDQLADICRRHGIRRLALFGSILRDDFGSASDVDVLVEFERDRVPGFFGLHRIESEIAGLFPGHAVDLLTYRSLNPHLRERVLA